MPTSVLEHLSYSSLNRCVHREASLFTTVRQLQKDSSNVTAADTKSPVLQITKHKVWQKAITKQTRHVSMIKYMSIKFGELSLEFNLK